MIGNCSSAKCMNIFDYNSDDNFCFVTKFKTALKYFSCIVLLRILLYLLDSLENQKSILVARDSIIEKLNSSIVMLKSEIGNKDEKMQSLTKEKDRIKTK